jgi:hypothetical protein
MAHKKMKIVDTIIIAVNIIITIIMKNKYEKVSFKKMMATKMNTKIMTLS